MCQCRAPRFHLLAYELAHLVKLLPRWLFVLQSNDVLAYGGRAEEGSDVARDAALFQIMQILRQGVPFDLKFDVRLFANEPRFHPIIYRAHRFAFAHDFGGDTLTNLALRSPILNERFV